MTALRWAARVRQAGRRAFVAHEWPSERRIGRTPRPCDLLVALHAIKSRPSIERFRAARPERAVVVACTGTDLYGAPDPSGECGGRGGRPGPQTLAVLATATRIVILQAKALEVLPTALHARTRVVHQSVEVPPGLTGAPPWRPGSSGDFEVCLVAHLRAVKDPLLAARALDLLPPDSRVRLRLIGGSLDPALTACVEREAARSRRLAWLGPLSRARTLAELARSHLCLSTSRDEGGSNVVSEALALDVPVLATAVPGTLGLLGEDHPGLFPAGDARALAGLLQRAERQPAFLEELRRAGRRRAWLTDPASERRAWRELLDELLPASHHGRLGGEPRRTGPPGPGGRHPSC